MEKLYNLSAPQNSILLTEQFYHGTAINNIGGGIIVHEALDFDLFKKAIHNFVKYNDSFRIRLKQTSSGVKQYFEDFSEFDINMIDLKNEEEVADLDQKILYQPIHIFEERLFEFTIFRFSNNHGGYVIKMHHLISDAWTSGLLCRKIMHEYSNLLKHENDGCNKMFSYTNYLETEENYFSSNKFEKNKKYWNDKFKELPNIVSIPAQKSSSDDFSCEGNRSSFVISKKDMEQITEYCTKHSVSVFNFFMAILSTYISKINRVNDFVIGTPILNRSNIAEKNTTGMFINTTALRICLKNKNTFTDLISSISQETMGLLRHQKYPYQTLLEDLRKQDASIPNLYNIVLSYQITRSNNECDIPYDTRWSFNGCTTDDLDIHLFDMDERGTLNIAYDYKISKYDSIDIENMHRRLMHIIKQVLKKEEVAISEIEIVTPEEKHKILKEFNNTTIDYPKDKTIVDLFEEQVQKTPDHIAIIFENQQLTYCELNEKANQLANYLISLKLKSNDKIAILLPRCSELIISMLAIKKANCAYLLIEKSLPIERIKYMLKNSNVSFTITNNQLATKELPDLLLLENIILDKLDNHNLNLNYLPENHLSVVYTSGSTGIPKGILVKNNSILNLVLGYCYSMKAHTLSNFLSTCSVSFDMFAAEVWIPLLLGKKLILANEEEAINPIMMLNLIKKYKIEFMLITPSKMNLLLLNNDNKCLQNLKAIQLGGEILNSQFYEKLKQYTNSQIYNGYGPSETTSCATCKQITSSKEITIGTPLPNIQVYICNQFNNLCPPNMIGELCIAGDGISYGYMNQTELTKQNFINNPFGDGLLYKTGDLAKFLPNGEIEFIGRNDNQVKIRGLRIELDEINKVIKQFPDVENSTILVKKINNIDTICCYFIGEKVSIDNLKNYTSKKLPHYMLPSHFIRLDSFPLTINGKINKDKLPEIKIESIYIKPKTKTEFKLATLWKNIFSLEKISITSDFFDLGGDSLNAIQLVSQIEANFNIKINIKDVFASPTIRDLAVYLDSLSLEKNKQNKIPKAKKMDYYPASSAQKRIYYASSLENNSILYNAAGGLIINENLDVNWLEKCFEKLIDRHEILRTHFSILNDEIVQIIEPKIDFKLWSENQNSNDLDYIYHDFVQPFDLSKAPLFRTKVVHLKNHKTLLLLDMHHIINDGTSFNIILEELCALYNNNALPKKQLDYKDFCLWEKEQFEKEDFQKAKDFWVNQYQNEIPLLNMPTTFPRPSVQSFEGANLYTTLSNETFGKINEVAKSLEVTPYMLMLAVYYVLLSKYTSQDDIVIGTPVVGRELPELYQMIGMFVNTLALRNKVKASTSFKDFVNQIKEYCLAAFQNQAYPFDELVKELNAKRDTSRNPLFDVLFVYQNNGYPTINFNDTTAEYFIPDTKVSKFDLTLEVIPIDNKFSLRFEYCTKLFDENFIKKFSMHYINILNHILENSDIKISDIDMLSQDEKNQILYNFNNTKTNYNHNKTIVDLFEEQVQKTPDHIAIVFENKKLTYRQLNEKANRLARFLIENGVSNHSIVGIMLPRSLEIIVSMLGILKTGASYIPLDPTYPKNRINYIIKDSHVNLLLTKDSDLTFKNANVVNISLSTSNIYKKYDKSNLNIAISPTDLAYIIYTSGSTGNPKGVAITHQNVNNFVKGVTSKIRFSNVIVSVTTISFDIFVLESILPLQKGLTIVIANELEQTIPELLNKLCIKNNVTMIQTTPSKFSLLISDETSLEFLNNIKTIMLGGEAFPVNLLTKIKNLTKCKIYNMYGPTETTVWSSIKDLTTTNNITIGTPIANTFMYVLDNQLNLLPPNVAGKLYIGGDGISKGYLNNQELTDSKFIINPYHTSEKIYNTGDLAKWTNDGELICLGRSDFQVKIRGLRIELGEIEKVILSFRGIEKTVVTTNTDSLNRQILCAYFTSKNRISVSELKQYLGMYLPNYMLPTYITQIEDFTYTPNGKIDIKSLPAPNFIDEKKQIRLPKTDTELKIIKIWEDLLCISPISTSDNFFDIGGDSLLALKMQMALLKEDINVIYSEIFKYNTIHKLASLIDKKLDNINADVDLANQYDYSNIDTILSNNHISSLTDMTYQPIENVLLTGVTGFLGAHILDYLMKHTNIKVYCLVRKDPSTSTTTKVLNKLNFYFGNVYDELINKRIFIINSDLTQDQLGLTDEKILSISNKISCVINSAAIVKHYGNYKDFEEINVNSVKKLVNFCKKYHKKLVQISTVSVSGNTLFDFATNTNDFTIDVDFKESNLYIGQSMENVYVHSKFEAEKLILEEIHKQKLDALILRIGNITNRASDGKFQYNSSENAFANKIKAFMELAAMPDYILGEYIEFSPVDYVAEAIIKAIEYSNKNISVLHIYNPNHVYIDKFIELLPQKYKLDIVSDLDFQNLLNALLKDDDKKYIISHILNDLNDENKLVYGTHIKIKSDFSQSFFEKAGFKWPIITKKYIENLLKNI